MERWQRQCAHIAPVVKKRRVQEQHQKNEQSRSAREQACRQRRLGDIDTSVNQKIEPTDDSVPAKVFASDQWIVTNAKVT
jgi:hypothetical protein